MINERARSAKRRPTHSDDNFISNETSYQHALRPLKRLGIQGGLYLGVGPNQNFTYIAHIRPKRAIIVDARRKNMIEHLLFKVLIEKSSTRQEYLYYLTGRDVQQASLPKNASVEDIIESIDTSVSDRSFFRQQLATIKKELLDRSEFGLRQGDFYYLTRIYNEFVRMGLDIKYDYWPGFVFPSLREFILEADLEGNRSNWLARHETFQYVRNMHQSNLIVPIVADLAGKNTFRQLARQIDFETERVSAFYVSTVEFYLLYGGNWLSFVENLRRLPIDNRSVLIRCYDNRDRPHPATVGDRITATVVQNIRNFLSNVDRGIYRSFWDVVTTDYEI